MTAFGASSSVASESARCSSHHVTLGADIVFFGWLIYSVAKKQAKTASRFPLGVVVLGVFLIMLDVVRHFLLDHGGIIVVPNKLAMYGETGLTPVGRFCQISTITGMTLLFAGVFLSMGIPQKLFGQHFRPERAAGA